MMVGMKKLLLLPILALFSCQPQYVTEPSTGGSCQVPAPSRLYGAGVSVANRLGWEYWDYEGMDLALFNANLSAGLTVRHDRDSICPDEDTLAAAFEKRGFYGISIHSNGVLTEVVAILAEPVPMQVRMRMYCDQPYTVTASCVHPHMTDMAGAGAECKTMLDSIRFE